MKTKKALGANQGTKITGDDGQNLLSASNYTPLLPQLQAVDIHLAEMHRSRGDARRWLDAFGAFLDAVEAVQQ